ncbi:hypothetical protein [Bosea sp. (in: a-proteobacteria)]
MLQITRTENAISAAAPMPRLASARPEPSTGPETGVMPRSPSMPDDVV